jgi:selenocysteine-specific elongation factor
MERRVILGTAGHIDHGKTALVRALTGVDTDRLPEEKKRGITIDLGFAPLTLEGVGTIGVVDVPGHEAFVRTMLAGATGIDLALLVVAADEGVMPQTREHLEILSLLRIPKCVIAITKSDAVDEDWLSLVVDEVRTLLSSTVYANAEILAVSAVTGRGMDQLRGVITSAATAIESRADDDLFRMPIDRAFSVVGTGTVVTGTVWSGSIASDAHVLVQPSGRKVRVRGIENHGSAVRAATPGMRTAIALAGVEVAEVARGMTLVGNADWVPTGEVEVLLDATAPDFTPRTRFRFHLGTAESSARFAHAHKAQGGTILARALLEEPLIARAGDRFVIRLPSPAMTVGGGEVIDPYPPRWRKAFEHDIAPATSTAKLDRMLRHEGRQGIPPAIIPIRTGMRPSQVADAVRAAGAQGAGRFIVSESAIARLADEITGIVSSEMANHRLQSGVSLEKLRQSLRVSPDLMGAVVDRMARKGVIEVEGSSIRPAGWAFTLGERDQAVRDAILHDICVAPVEPPSVAELSSKFGSSTVALLKRLERDGAVERVSDDRYYGRDAIDRMVGVLRAELDPGRAYSPSEIREVLGVSRKYLIPFLEFCDRKGFTVRLDQGRMLKQDQGR